jgi:hypothetical protein
MVLATIESQLYVSATLMLLNAENWKDRLRMFSIVIMFIQIYAHPDSVVTSKDYSYLSEVGM